MATIPNIAHFVFGFREQSEPFHLLHYLAIESCRRIQQPDTIYFHYHELPGGLFWDLVRPHLTLRQVAQRPEILGANYDESEVPAAYRYAHHADFVRLDALIEYGGLYADIDTLFLKPLPECLWDEQFVIGREYPTWRPATGSEEPGLCNALMLAAPGASFARRWRDQMSAALDGSWSHHSCDLALRLSQEWPDELRVEAQECFMGVPASQEGLAWLLQGKGAAPPLDRASSIHLWAHLWWEADRADFSSICANQLTLDVLRKADVPLANLARPFLPDIDLDFHLQA
ncbi:MAG: glycosyltransferase [Pseudomonadota bacterium]